LQSVLEDIKIIPVVMGEHSHPTIEAVATGLAEVLNSKKALIIASTDLSHFYNDKKARELDNVVVDAVTAFDDEELFSDLQNGRCEMCGGGPTVAAMKASKLLGADTSRVMMYQNSGKVSGDMTEVVGYLSAIFYQAQ
jgi:AmmeMemoRadiSam system protein B